VVEIAVDCVTANVPERKENVGIAAIWVHGATFANKAIAKTKKDTRLMNPRLERLIRIPPDRVDFQEKPFLGDNREKIRTSNPNRRSASTDWRPTGDKFHITSQTQQSK